MKAEAGESKGAAATRIYTWGQGTEGQLGHWPFEKGGLTGAYVELSPRELNIGGKGDNSLEFVEMAAGLNYTAAITADGKVFTWGEGSYGKLGHGNTKNVYKPKQVEAFEGVKIVKVACG